MTHKYQAHSFTFLFMISVLKIWFSDQMFPKKNFGWKNCFAIQAVRGFRIALDMSLTTLRKQLGTKENGG